MKTYPGKQVPEAELREARERAWDALMEQARRESRINGDRRRVVGALGHRGRWVYVIQCGSDCTVCDQHEERARA